MFAQGPVGLCATMGANLLGAGRIIAVESRPERQALAKRFGADDIVDFTQGDPVEQIMDMTGGEGVDAAIEAFGFPQTFEACLRVTKAGGRVSNIGYHGENPAPLQLPLDAFGLGMNDKAIHTGLCPGGNERMTRIFRLMITGRVDPTPMTTHTFPFDDIDRAFEMMTTKEDGIIKPLITFGCIVSQRFPSLRTGPLPTRGGQAARSCDPSSSCSRSPRCTAARDMVVRAVDGVDLVVERGDYVAVMGASGSGKSTLMNIIGCLDVAHLRALPPRRRRHAAARRAAPGARPQPQDRVHLPVVQPDPAHDRGQQRRAADGLRGRPPGERRERAVRALEQVGLGEPGAPPAVAAVRRAAAAGGDRPRDRDGPGAPARRRADRQRWTATAPTTSSRCSTT